MRTVKNVKKGEGEIDSIAVARILDTSPDNVNYMARKGILPGHKEKKFWRFNKRAIARWAKTHKMLEA